jgi:phospholipid/cholesterol/gamma-HCH transport system substrate-binding protein
VVLTAALAVAGTVALSRHPLLRATAYFTQTKGLYVGDDVQIQGVRVGTITAIAPEPGQVRVEFNYDADQPVPANAQAVLVAPSLVTVRHVELAPTYAAGPQLADYAVIPLARTVVPVEFDEIKDQLNALAQTLGPNGVNADGSLNRFLTTTAANLNGQGANLNQTVRSLSEAMSTLAESRGDLFGTVRNLQVFTTALAHSDAQVAQFNQRLAAVSSTLADDRDQLGAALHGLNTAFTDVTAFLRDNRATITDTVRDLQPVADTLAENRQQIADVLQLAPTALSNLNNVYDPASNSLTGVLALANLNDPQNLICGTILNLGGSPQQCHTALAALPSTPPLPIGVSVLERNGQANQVVAVPGSNLPHYNGHNGPANLDQTGTSGIVLGGAPAAETGPGDIVGLLTPGAPR